MRLFLLLFFGLSIVAGAANGQAVPPLEPVVPAVQLYDSALADSLLITRRQWTHCPSVTTIQELRPLSYPTLQPTLSLAPGVQVTPTSGAPGDWTTVRIRGGSSLASTEAPLYVLDGVPVFTFDGESGSVLRSGYRYGEGPQSNFGGPNPLLSVPVEDIADVTVVQGALGTAQYGAQGSNGVILITTKRGGSLGQRQPLRIRYSGYGGVQQVRQRYELLNASQFIDLNNEAARNVGLYAGVNANSPNTNANTDWQAELFRAAVLHNHHLSFDGSSERTRYAVQTDYLNQQGVVQNSSLRRYALRLNLDHQVGQRLHLLLNASAAHLHQVLPDFRAVPTALLAPPIFPVRQANGDYFRTDQSYGTSGYMRPFINPLALVHEGGDDGTMRRLLLQVGASYSFSPRLTLHVLGSREQSNLTTTSVSLSARNNSTVRPSLDYTRDNDRVQTATNAQLRLNYVYNFTEDQPLTLTAVANYQQYDTTNDLSLRSPDGPPITLTGQATYSVSNASLLASYTYKKRYQVLASLRADANRDLFYRDLAAHQAPIPTMWLPGAEVRWHLHQEDFMSTIRALSTATVWVGMGQASATSNPSVNTGYSIIGDHYAGYPGQVVFTLPSTGASLSPPRTTQLEAGLRLGMGQDKVQLEVTAYRRTSANVGVPQVGVQYISGGYGHIHELRDVTLRNQGLQLALGSTWKIGRLEGSTRLAAAWQQQRVMTIVDIPGLEPAPGLVVGEPPILTCSTSSCRWGR